MDRIGSLLFFVRVVESGSFSQAARELGVGQPAVSKQVAALEKRLKAQLLTRTSRELRPTAAGQEFYESAVRILEEIDAAESRVADGHGQVVGAVRVAVPPIMTSMMIVPELPKLFDSFPEISVEFVSSVRNADLVHEGLDLAIRVGNLEDSGLLGRRIGSMRIATVAGADYLRRHGVPSTPSDLNNHELLANRYRGALIDWRFSGAENKEFTPKNAKFSCNTPVDMSAAVLAGLGIAQSARGLFEEDIDAGRVIEVLADFAPAPVPIHALYCNTKVPKRVRIVSDFVASCLNNHEGFRL